MAKNITDLQFITWAKENGFSGSLPEIKEAHKQAHSIPRKPKERQEITELVTVVLTHGNKSKVFRGLHNNREEFSLTLFSLAETHFKGKDLNEIQVTLSKEVTLYDFLNKVRDNRGRPKGSKKNPSPTDTPTPQSE